MLKGKYYLLYDNLPEQLFFHLHDIVQRLKNHGDPLSDVYIDVFDKKGFLLKSYGAEEFLSEYYSEHISEHVKRYDT